MRPIPYTPATGWMPLDESTLFRAHGVDYAAVQREPDAGQLALDLLREWGLDADSIHTAFATDARVEERDLARGGPGSGVGGGLFRARVWT